MLKLPGTLGKTDSECSQKDRSDTVRKRSASSQDVKCWVRVSKERKNKVLQNESTVW